MKKNIIKSITLSSLLILTSCNSTSYKYDEPLFITGDIADDSVKNNFFEKTKNYSNFIPDGCYEYTHISKVKYNDEYIDYLTNYYKIKYISSIDSKTGKLTYTLDKYIHYSKTSDNPIFKQDRRNIVYEIIYDGNTFVRHKATPYLDQKVYYQNVPNSAATIDLLIKYIFVQSTLTSYYNLINKNNVYHFELIDYKEQENIYHSNYYEDIGFEYNSNFTKLNRAAYIFIYFGYYFKDSQENYNKDYSIGVLKCIEDFEIKIPDLSEYTLKQFNEDAFTIY